MTLKKISGLVKWLVDHAYGIAASCLIWYVLDPELVTIYARIHLVIASALLTASCVRWIKKEIKITITIKYEDNDEY